MVAPLVWDFKRGESRTTVVFPLGAQWHRTDARPPLVPYVYYGKGSGEQDGTWHLDVFPFVQVGRPRKTTSSGTSSRASSATRAKGATVTFVSSGSSTSPSSRCRRRPVVVRLDADRARELF